MSCLTRQSAGRSSAVHKFANHNYRLALTSDRLREQALAVTLGAVAGDRPFHILCDSLN